MSIVAIFVSNKIDFFVTKSQFVVIHMEIDNKQHDCIQ